MAWTAPKTFVANFALSAAELNIFLRDNMLEQVANKCTASNVGWYPIVTDPNTLTMRQRADATVIGSGSTETTSSTDWGDLPNLGPSVTIVTGSAAMVIMTMQSQNSTVNASCRMSFQISGATERDPSDNYAVCQMTNTTASGHIQQWSAAVWADGLTEGTNTFTAKYRVGAGTGQFDARRLCVMPFS